MLLYPSLLGTYIMQNLPLSDMHGADSHTMLGPW